MDKFLVKLQVNNSSAEKLIKLFYFNGLSLLIELILGIQIYYCQPWENTPTLTLSVRRKYPMLERVNKMNIYAI